jgi:hypothetical protein
VKVFGCRPVLHDGQRHAHRRQGRRSENPDGETAEEALANVHDAIAAWIGEAQALGRAIPPPSRRHVAAE